MGDVHHVHLVRVLRPLLLALLLAGCAYSARPPLRFADLPYRWPEKSVELDEGRVSYVELNPEGAQTVILIHGLGSYLKFWSFQLDELAAKGYRVIALDLPGYGKSDKPASFPYTMEAFAGVVHELTGRLGIDHPILFGHSMGGHIAVTYELLYPGEARALVLASPAGFEAFSPRERAWFAAVVRTELFVAATEEDLYASVRASPAPPSFAPTRTPTSCRCGGSATPTSCAPTSAPWACRPSSSSGRTIG